MIRCCYINAVGHDLAEQHAHPGDDPCPQRYEFDAVHAEVARRLAEAVAATWGRALSIARGERNTFDDDNDLARADAVDRVVVALRRGASPDAAQAPQPSACPTCGTRPGGVRGPVPRTVRPEVVIDDDAPAAQTPPEAPAGQGRACRWCERPKSEHDAGDECPEPCERDCGHRGQYFHVYEPAPPQQGTAPTRDCTGMTAVWCPVHGDCICPYIHGNPAEGRTFDGRSACPLHSASSDHGEKEDAPLASLGEALMALVQAARDLDDHARIGMRAPTTATLDIDTAYPHDRKLVANLRAALATLDALLPAPAQKETT